MPTDIQGEDHLDVAFDHAWNWFSLHATQRLQAVNFFLVAAAFLSAAYVTAMKDHLHMVAAGVSILAASIAYFFYRMERRIRSLVHAAEAALLHLETKLSGSLNIDELNIVSRVEHPKPGEWKYSKVFRGLYLTTAMAFILGFLYACWAAAQANPGPNQFNIAIQAVLGCVLLFVGYEMLISLPLKSPDDGVQNGSRITLLLLGVLSAVLGFVVIFQLVFFRL